MNEIEKHGKLLIIDEKMDYRDDGTGFQFYKILPNYLRKNLRVCTDVSEALEVKNENEVDVLFNNNDYLWIFYHDSYRDKSLESSQLEDFKDKVKNLIVFSGGKEEIGFKVKSTTRRLLFERLRMAIEVWHETGHFPIKYLCQRDVGPHYSLLEALDDFLLDDNKDGFINSKELILILKKLNYSETEINEKIIPYYRKLSTGELIEKIEQWNFKMI